MGLIMANVTTQPSCPSFGLSLTYTQPDKSHAPPRPEDGNGAQAEPPRSEDVAVAQDVARHAARLHEGVGEEEDDACDGVEDHLC